jgi:hypothetical protein
MGRGSVQVARTLARIEKSSAVALSEDPGGKNKWDDPNPLDQRGAIVEPVELATGCYTGSLSTKTCQCLLRATRCC